MRTPPLLSLLVPAALGAGLGAVLVSCHKEPTPQATAAPAQQTLKLQAYDPVIPKATAQGPKLETTAPHPPIVAQAASAAPFTRDDIEAPAEALPPPLPRPPSMRRAYAQAQIQAEPGSGRYVDAPAYSPYRPGDQRAADAPEPSGFRLNVKICRQAERQSDPLAQTPECQSLLQAARAQQDACARAFEAGDDAVVLSPACRQAAMGR